MTTKPQLESALKDAIRHGKDVQKRTLRMALSVIKLAEVEKGDQLDEAEIASILHKEVKSRHESIADAQKANRPDLIAASEAEIAIVESFLPKPFSPEELESLSRQVVAEMGATSMRDMGQVMKALLPRVQGRATGDQVSQAVRKLLQG
jgi:uncharacterized protein YqeY